MKKGLAVKQRDAADCGPACLASVAAWYQSYPSLWRIRDLAGTKPSGTTVYGMVRAADKLGFTATAWRCSLEDLEFKKMPVIAHVLQDQRFWHYVVIVQIRGQRVWVMDPALGSVDAYSTGSFLKIWNGVVIVPEPGTQFIRHQKIGKLRRLRMLVKPGRWSLLLAALLAVIGGVLMIRTSMFLKNILDAVQQKDIPAIGLVSVMVLLVLMIQFPIQLARGVISLRSGKRMDGDLIDQYCQRVLRLPQSMLDGVRTGELVNRVNDAVKISGFVNDVLVNVMINLVVLLMSLTVMIARTPRMALVVICSLPWFGILFFFHHRISGRWEKKILSSAALMDAELVEAMSSIKTIKTLGLTEVFHVRLRHSLAGWLNHVTRSAISSTAFSGAGNWVVGTCMVVPVWIGAYQLPEPGLTGTLASFYVLDGIFTSALIYLLSCIRPFREATIAADRLFDILDEPGEVSGTQLISAVKEIRFCAVCFEYTPGETILDNITLTIPECTMVGVAGKTGSGKSTLFALLQKLYLPLNGNIEVNGCDISAIDNDALRSAIIPVPQHAQLFSDTIRENISAGVKHQDPDWMAEIIVRAGLNDFIETLPSGLDTILTGQGNNLSGGQKQKISIARALYRRPSVLLLDEPTANLDAQAERKMMETFIWYRSLGNIVIIIAHKDEVLNQCDRVFRIADGRLI